MTPELLDDLFRSAVSRLGRRLADHHIAVQMDDPMLMVSVNAQLVERVLVNLMDNAIQYTPKGSNITLRGYRKDDMAHIIVADDGPGIPEEAKKHLFDMFYTASCGKSDDRRGLGLGLNLCRSIITAHGGTISVTDNSPHGSVFTFTLPLEEIKITNEQIE